MKTALKISGLAAAFAMGAAAFSATPRAEDTALVPTLTAEHIAADAALTFNKIDVDRSGTLDAQEYAAQAIVFAKIAREQRLVTIDASPAVQIAVPQDVESILSARDRLRIDAIARAEFHHFAGDDGQLSPVEWEQARSALFHQADRNADGRLKAEEVAYFATHIAQHTLPA